MAIVSCRVWGADVGPYMQFLHACFAIGTVFGPLVVGIVLDMYVVHIKCLFKLAPL